MRSPRSILVIEPWGIGDVVLATPLLTALRHHFPEARVSLLAKSHAKALLAGSGLVDEIVEYDFPWTAFKEKFRLERYNWSELRALVRYLRTLDVDVSIDARRDSRSNLISYLAGARCRIGYDFGGGAHLLTHALPSGLQNEHKVSDWLSLLSPLVPAISADFKPTLTVSDEERKQARAELDSLGFSRDQPLIGIHPGASHALRHWDPRKFGEVADAITSRGAQVVVFGAKDDASEGVRSANAVRTIRTDLREFMALVSQCDSLVCADSGPMHVAGALGVPVTAIFGPQRREWYGPMGEVDEVVQLDNVECRPCFDNCIFSSPICMDGVDAAQVVRALEGQLGRVASGHRQGEI